MIELYILLLFLAFPAGVLMVFLIVTYLGQRREARQTKRNLELEIEAALRDIQWTKSDPQLSQYRQSIEDYRQVKVVAGDIRQRADHFYIPTLTSGGGSNEPEQLLDRIVNLIERNSPAFAGAEQAILGLISLEHSAQVISKASEIFAEHFAAAKMEMIGQFEQMAQGAQWEIQSNEFGELAAKCLNSYFAGMAEHADKIVYLEKPLALLMLADGNLRGFFLNFHSITRGLDPVLHLNDAFLPQFKEIAATHGQEIMQALTAEIGSSLEAFDPSGHFPVVTLLVSGYREVRLLDNQQTKLGKSLEHISWDLLGSGGGGFAGAKLGALAGTAMGGPVGTVIGAIGGGIIGAVGGRALTNKAKFAPFKEAQDAYSSLQGEWSYEHPRWVQQMYDTVQGRSLTCSRKFQADQQPFPDQGALCEVLNRLYRELLSAARQELYAVERRLAGLPLEQLEQPHPLLRSARQVRNRIRHLRDRLPGEEAIERYPLSALEMLLELPALKGGSFAATRTSLMNDFREAISLYYSAVLSWSFQLVAKHRETMHHLSDTVQREATAYQKFVDQWKRKLQAAEKKLREEAGYLDIPL